MPESTEVSKGIILSPCNWQQGLNYERHVGREIEVSTIESKLSNTILLTVSPAPTLILNLSLNLLWTVTLAVVSLMHPVLSELE